MAYIQSPKWGGPASTVTMGSIALPDRTFPISTSGTDRPFPTKTVVLLGAGLIGLVWLFGQSWGAATRKNPARKRIRRWERTVDDVPGPPIYILSYTRTSGGKKKVIERLFLDDEKDKAEAAAKRALRSADNSNVALGTRKFERRSSPAPRRVRVMGGIRRASARRKRRPRTN